MHGRPTTLNTESSTTLSSHISKSPDSPGRFNQQIATPFEWKFTKADLNELLERVTAHHNVQLTPAA
jgi:hypothetical protein